MKYHHDVSSDFVVERDSQSPGAHAGAFALDPRMPSLPCGKIVGGGQSDTFQLATVTRTLRLFWNFADATLRDEVVRIMQVDPYGGDEVAASAMAHNYLYIGFKPFAGRFYYIYVSGTFFRVVVCLLFASLSQWLMRLNRE